MKNIFDNLLAEYEKPDLEDFINDFEKAEYLQKLLINMSTNDGPAYDDHYDELRKYFMKNDKTKRLLPSYVINNRDLSQFWQYIKYKLSTYAERRQYIRNNI